MAGADSTTLAVATREPSGSRSARRLRRDGHVPGVVYGGGKDPVSFSIGSRELRLALAHAGAVLDLQIDGERGTPVVVKELVRHPVNGETVHVDLLRVRLDRPIQATVILDLVGAEDAPGIKTGGVLEQQVRELTIEALPNDIPDTITHDVSTLEIGDIVTLDAIQAPAGVTIIGEPDAAVATLSAPRLQVEPETEIEEETEVVGEAAESASEETSDGDGASDESGSHSE
jgi:large subunit ribosomal protein L25